VAYRTGHLKGGGYAAGRSIDAMTHHLGD